MLEGFIPDELIRAVKTHNYEHTKVKAENRVEKALIASDAISGLLVACALVMPAKKLADVKVETVERSSKTKTSPERLAEREYSSARRSEFRERFFEVALNGLKECASPIEL